MSLILYPKTETAFDTNGIGILADAIDDEVYEELNGQFELTVQYPVTGRHFAEIVTDAYITAKPNPVSDPQPFRIYRITKPMNGVVTIYARHIAYKCRKIAVSPFSASNVSAALQGLKTNAANDCPFEFWTDKVTAATMNVAVPTSLWTLLGGSKGSILDTYGGEYEFDRTTVKLWNRRGADRGVTIRYGKNLTDLKQDENIANVYTGIYPYWTDGDGNLVQLPERYVNGPGVYDEEKILPVDMSQAFEAKPTEDELRAAAEKYIADNDIGKPDVSWTVEFVQLEQTTEYKGKAILNQVLLGDTVSVIFPQQAVDVSARAVAVRYKPSQKRYKNITLGKVRANLASTIAQQGQAIAQTSKGSNVQAAANSAVARATSWITNGRGYMVAVRDAAGNWQEICSLDTPDLATAVNVWRWNNGGLGFSRNGYDGPYEVAITQDGYIIANFITVGKMASADGRAYIDLDNGFFGIDGEPDADGAYTGMRLKDNCIWGIAKDASGAVTRTFDLYAMAEGVALTDGLLFPSGRHIKIYSTGGLQLGTGGAPVTLTGSEIHIKGAPIYLGSKSLKWVDSGNGYSYLVGVEEETA